MVNEDKNVENVALGVVNLLPALDQTFFPLDRHDTREERLRSGRT